MATQHVKTYKENAQQRKDLDVTIAEMGKDLSYVVEKVDKIDEQLSANYVTKTEFDPIKKVVYGMVSLILTAVVVALVGLIMVR